MKSTPNYTTHYTPEQLILPMDLSINLPKDSAVRTYAEIMKGIALKKYFIRRQGARGRLPKNRVRILKAILFGYMVDLRSTRAIESSCQNDIRFMWLIRNNNSTIAYFYRERHSRGRLRFNAHL